MIIAFEINFHQNSDSLIQEFNLKLFSHFSRQYPNHKFILISNKSTHQELCNLPNQTFIKSISWGLNFINAYLNRLLLFKKHKIDILISDGIYNLNKFKHVKQFHWLNDLKSFKKIETFSKNSYVFCVNEYLISLLEENKVDFKKQATAITPFIEIPQSIKTIENEKKTKEKFSNNKEYFLYNIDPSCNKDEIITIIKAFSHFKKWQKSNMQFVLLIQHENEEKVKKLIESFKFKDDVTIICENNNTIFFELLSSAYGCIIKNKSIALTEKMIVSIQMNIPIILDENEFYKSSFGEACIYSEMNELKLSQKLILLYKDEEYREEVIAQTKIFTNKLNWDNVTNQIWSLISAEDKN